MGPYDLYKWSYGPLISGLLIGLEAQLPIYLRPFVRGPQNGNLPQVPGLKKESEPPSSFVGDTNHPKLWEENIMTS